MIALAPAFMVSKIVSSFGPPVAIMGTFGKSLRMFLTISAVFAAAKKNCIATKRRRLFYPFMKIIKMAEKRTAIRIRKAKGIL